MRKNKYDLWIVKKKSCSMKKVWSNKNNNNKKQNRNIDDDRKDWNNWQQQM